MTRTALFGQPYQAKLESNVMSLAHATAQYEASSNPVTASSEIITPEKASDLLANNPRNRKMSLAAIRRYRAAMAEGRWRVNGSTIVIAENGALLDGQQRLTACVQAGVSFQTIVVRRCATDVFETIDSGRKRTASDALSIMGFSDCRSLSAAARWAVALQNGTAASGPAVMSNDEICAWVDQNPGIQTSLNGTRGTKTILIGSIAGGVKFHFDRMSEDASERFFADLSNPAGLPADDAVWMLERRLSRNIIKKEKLPAEEILALVIRAWNHRRTGERTVQLKGLIRRPDGTATMPSIV